MSRPGKNKLRLKRHKRIRGKISGTAKRPRLSVFHSDKNIYAQLVGSVEDVILASASASDKNISAESSKIEQAAEADKALAKTAAEKGVKSVVFDRSGHLYRGRVQTLADTARENGLGF